MMIIGFLTIDSEANMNSRIGALLLSFFIPMFIIWKTQQMSGLKRMLKFGSGLVAYAILAMVLTGFVVGFVKGLFVCIVVALTTFYYGGNWMKEKA
jgi:hypothetical protein